MSYTKRETSVFEASLSFARLVGHPHEVIRRNAIVSAQENHILDFEFSPAIFDVAVALLGFQDNRFPAFDAPISIDHGQLVLFDSSGEIAATESYINPYRSDVILQPGEYAYIRQWFSPEINEADLGEFHYTQPTQDVASGVDYTEVSCTTEIVQNSNSLYTNSVEVTFTNTTGEPMADFGVLSAIKDQTGRLICINHTSKYYIVVHPDSAITVSVNIDRDLITYFQERSISLTSVNAIVYVK